MLTRIVPAVWIVAFLAASSSLVAAEPSAENAETAAKETAAPPAVSPEHAEFFESKVRPLLVKRCLECHGDDPKDVRGGLSLTNRAGWVVGGDTGPAIVPGDPDKSLFIQA
ncbi:MAG TPA: c-type cytochrome domain-containing protein, partial [Pirellulales bacterium]